MLNYEREQQQRFANEASRTTYREILQGTNARRTWISWLPLQYQGLGGLSFVLSYTTYFFQLAGMSNPFLGNVIVKTMQLSAQIVSFYNIERFGRRPLLLIGGAGMMIMNLAIAIIGSVPGYTPNAGLVITFFCLWVWSYSSSCAPIGYCYLAEISTPRLRAKTAGFAASMTCLFGVSSSGPDPQISLVLHIFDVRPASNQRPTSASLALMGRYSQTSSPQFSSRPNKPVGSSKPDTFSSASRS